MKKENFNERYVAPEAETIQVKLGTVLNTSCTENTMEGIVPVNPDCPKEEQDW